MYRTLDLVPELLLRTSIRTSTLCTVYYNSTEYMVLRTEYCTSTIHRYSTAVYTVEPYILLCIHRSMYGSTFPQYMRIQFKHVHVHVLDLVPGTLCYDSTAVVVYRYLPGTSMLLE